MRITWKITKPRGVFRPELTYKLEREGWEAELNIPKVYAQSTIPQPSDPVTRINNERTLENDEGTSTHRLVGSSEPQKIRLPFRQSGEYPEVAESMAILRAEIERRIIQAHDALALDITGELEMTPATKKHVAAYAAAWKMTQAGKEY